MSFNFRKAGKDVEALKASVQAENAPQPLKDELCRRIEQTGALIADGYYKGCCILVHALGHLELDAEGRVTLASASLERFEVSAVPFLDTPVQS